MRCDRRGEDRGHEPGGEALPRLDLVDNAVGAHPLDAQDAVDGDDGEARYGKGPDELRMRLSEQGRRFDPSVEQGAQGSADDADRSRYGQPADESCGVEAHVAQVAPHIPCERAPLLIAAHKPPPVGSARQMAEEPAETVE